MIAVTTALDAQDLLQSSTEQLPHVRLLAQASSPASLCSGELRIAQPSLSKKVLACA